MHGLASPDRTIPLDQAFLEIHVYQPSEAEAFEELATSGNDNSPGDDVMAASVCELPSKALDGLWDT